VTKVALKGCFYAWTSKLTVYIMRSNTIDTSASNHDAASSRYQCTYQWIDRCV